jgi:hypothetical protein
MLEFLKSLLPLVDTLCVIVPILLAVAFMTILERKVLAATQRRVGPDTVGLDYRVNKENLVAKPVWMRANTLSYLLNTYKTVNGSPINLNNQVVTDPFTVAGVLILIVI